MCKVGDRIAYSVQWLRSIGIYGGDLPAARGTVMEIHKLGERKLATIQWEPNADELPARVMTCNLACVGLNTRFSAC